MSETGPDPDLSTAETSLPDDTQLYPTSESTVVSADQPKPIINNATGQQTDSGATGIINIEALREQAKAAGQDLPKGLDRFSSPPTESKQEPQK